jgi:site-specific DNA recombinase
MTPTHSTKKTKRYRYYVSALLLACPQAQKGMRVPAGDMEGLVLERLRAFFASRTNIGGRPISPKKPSPSAFGRSTLSGP